MKNYRFDYVIIDEAQDFSLSELKMMSELYKPVVMTDTIHLTSDEFNNSLFIAMDANQNLYGHKWRLNEDIGLTTVRKNLPMTFRNSKEIDVFCHDLKEANSKILTPEDREDLLSDKSTEILPRVIRCKNPAAEKQFVKKIALTLSRKDSNLTVAILCRHRNAILDYARLLIDRFPDDIELGRLSAYLEKRTGKPSIQYDEQKNYSPSSPGIKLTTIHTSKGLGFDAVIIPSFEYEVLPESDEQLRVRVLNKINISEVSEEKRNPILDAAVDELVTEERKLAYVAVTRAKIHLILTYSGVPSTFLQEIRPEHYAFIDLTSDSSAPNDPLFGDTSGDADSEPGRYSKSSIYPTYDPSKGTSIINSSPPKVSSPEYNLFGNNDVKRKLSEQLQATYKYDSDKTITEFIKQLNESIDTEKYGKISNTEITNWLRSHGYLVKEYNSYSAKETFLPSSLGIEIGINTKKGISSKGEKYITPLYSKKAQDFVINHLAQILGLGDYSSSSNF